MNYSTTTELRCVRSGSFSPFCHEGVGHIFTGFPAPPCLILRGLPDEEEDDDGDTTLGELAIFFLGALAATATGAGRRERTCKKIYHDACQ